MIIQLFIHTRLRLLPTHNIITSSSDNLFHPVPNAPSSYVYFLSKVPSNPRSHEYDSMNTFHHPLPDPMNTFHRPLPDPTNTFPCPLPY